MSTAMDIRYPEVWDVLLGSVTCYCGKALSANRVKTSGNAVQTHYPLPHRPNILRQRLQNEIVRVDIV